MRTLVYLHGVGDGDPAASWKTALNEALSRQGIPVVAARWVVAPRYDDLLNTDGVAAKMPDVTYRVRDDTMARREFERRQSEVFRRVGGTPGVRGFGFNVLPTAVMLGLQQVGLHAPISEIKQVNRYVQSEDLRGAVLRRILSRVPVEGEIVLVAHSLGSVIAIDLLDHLPPALHISRFVTLGSPANVEALHRGSTRLLMKFPYARVDDWTNVLGHRDPITGGRGLANTFPGAQDFEVDIGLSHGAATYLGQPWIAQLVGEMLADRPALAAAPAAAGLAVRMTDEQADVLFGLAFAHALAAHMEDADAAGRYRDALRSIQGGVSAQLQQSVQESGDQLSSEVAALADGCSPEVPERFDMAGVVLRLTTLAESNLIAPYEIETGKALLPTLQDFAGQLGYQRVMGNRIAEALAEVREHTGRRGVPWGRVLTGAAGLALIAAGPVGLLVAAPAGAFGAAAIVGGLAAFGPGGMVGGMAMMGGLAAVGGAAAAAAAVSQAHLSAMDQAGALLVRVAAQRALQLQDVPHDPDLWFAVANLETTLAAQIARLTPFSDRKAPGLVDRERALDLAVSLLGYITVHGLGPAELGMEDHESGSVPAGSIVKRVSLRRQFRT